MHGHVHTNNKKVLLISFFYYRIIYVSKIIGGFIANSLALLSDGFHMLSDTISLGVALIALYMRKNATQTKTYGYKRFEVLPLLYSMA